MSRTKESQNKARVLEAFDTLFNKRDYVAAERYWSPNYIQHSAHIEPGDVLQDEASQAESKSGRPMFGDSFTE